MLGNGELVGETGAVRDPSAQRAVRTDGLTLSLT